MFATEEDMKTAQSKPFMYNNFRVYWVNSKEKETRKREDFKEERGRSWDRYSQISNTEDVKSKERKQRNRTYTNRERSEEFWKD